MRMLLVLQTLLVVLVAAPARAQQPDAQRKIDSLEKVIAATNDDAKKAWSLIYLSLALREAGKDNHAVKTGKQALELARRAGQPEIEAEYWNNLGVFYYKKGGYDKAIENYARILEMPENSGLESKRASALNNIGTIYAQRGAFNEALKYFTQSVDLLKASGDELGYAKSLHNVAGIYLSQGDFPRALERYEESLEIKRKLGYRSQVAMTQQNIATVYVYQGNLVRALERYQQCLKIYEELGMKSEAAIAAIGIGTVAIQMREYDQALRYYEKSLQLFRELGGKQGIADALKELASVYLLKKKSERALKLYQKSLALYEELGALSGSTDVLTSIGTLYLERGEHARALDYLNKSLQLSRENGNRPGEANTLTVFARALLMTGQPREARQRAARALTIATEVGKLDAMHKASGVSAQTDSALGDWQSAYEHFKLFKQYSDSLNNDAQSKEIGRLEAQYDFDKEIEAREKREAEAAARRRMLYWIAAGVFAALALVAGLLTWGFRTKQKANKLLASQNAEIIQQSEEISRQRDELHAMNAQITEQRDVLEKAHEEITDSIDYASRIQHALLPSPETMRQNADVYVYYKARDVVSGDFYWTHRIDEDTVLYAAADCTGHGVPGAFMSVLGATTLDTVVREYGETRPDKMLGLLDRSIRQSLKQDESKDGSLDGMDLALVKLDKKNRKLYFSSAGRPLFLLRNGEIIEYKGAKFPAGGAQHDDKTFPLIEIDLVPGDRIFLCSDGITDQFGGPRGRKFSPKRLKETLLAHQDKDLQTQGKAFAAAFEDWQSSAKQLDDQLLVGICPGGEGA